MSFDQYKAECECCTLSQDIKESLCPVCITQRVMRGKWKFVLIWLLRDKSLRFTDLKKKVPNITQAYLSSQLKDLESDNIVNRISYNEIPPRVEYSLTEEGRSFIKVMESISEWGIDYFTSQIQKQIDPIN